MENNKIHKAFRDQVKPFLDGYTERLLKELEREKIIVPVINQQDAEVLYKLNLNELQEQPSNTVAPKDIFKQLFEFRNIVRNVYYNLRYPDSDNSRGFTLMQVVSKLDERGAFSAPWKNNEDVVFVIDKLDALVGGEENIKVREQIEKTISDNKINVNNLTLRLLKFYGAQKTTSYFSDFEYKTVNKNTVDRDIDLTLSHARNIYPELSFEFKYRRKSVLPARELILKSLQQIETLNKKGKSNSFYFLVIFTEQNRESFEKVRLQFKQTLKEIDKYEECKGKIRFVPVAINYLHLIEEELNFFKEIFIQQDIQFTFKNQPTPKNQPDRNDHFLERTFDFKKSNFEITINPQTTKFWRFGFKFSPSEKFPLITEDRHIDINNGDIHICVGDLEAGNVWGKPNQLGIAPYHVDTVTDEFSGINNYDGKPVGLVVKSNEDGSNVEFELKVDGNTIGKKAFNLSKFKYCRIHAWCDYSQFQLDTQIKVIHKGCNYDGKEPAGARVPLVPTI